MDEPLEEPPSSNAMLYALCDLLIMSGQLDRETFLVRAREFDSQWKAETEEIRGLEALLLRKG
jgi:hypothetical protein